MSNVILRQFNPETDSGLIYSSYPKGVYYKSHLPITTPKSDWFKDFYLRAKHQLEHATVHIACLEYDPDTILGYSIVDNDELQFVYVKEDFRNKGIATLLTKNKYTAVNQSNLTQVGYSILESRRNDEAE